MNPFGIEGIHIGVDHIAVGILVDGAHALEQRIGRHDVARLHEHDEIAFHRCHTRREALVDAQGRVGFHHIHAIAVDGVFQIGRLGT